MQKLLAAGVEHDVRAAAVLLLAEDNLSGQRAVVEDSSQTGQLPVDETAKCGRDVDVPAGEFQTHSDQLSAFSSQRSVSSPLPSHCLPQRSKR